jgi:DNA-binding CsgD family transcriptional regulator
MSMRYFTFTLIPLEEDRDFHPITGDFKDHPDIRQEQLKYISLLEDKTGLVLFGLRGSEDAVREVLTDHPAVRKWQLIPGDGGGFFCYIHFDEYDPAVGLLELLDSYKLVLDLPLHFTEAGNLRVTVIGDNDDIKEALLNVPPSIEAEAMEIGEYRPDDGRAIASLTERQREVLEAAVELGYYEVPRQATYEDIAEACDCTVGTVGEHLNRIESRIIANMMQ